MIEGYIHARKLVYLAESQLGEDVAKLYDNMRLEVDQAATKAEQAHLSTDINLGPMAQKPQATPPMLPSPASIAPANSANSTPITRDDGTPPSHPALSTSHLRPPLLPGQHPIRGKLLPQRYREAPIPADTMDAMLSVTSRVSLPFLQNIKEQVNGTTAAAHCLRDAQATLNLTTLVRFFPTTFARVIKTTLLPTEEHEPDIEDEEGELYWPAQSITGEGLGWVCLLGKAMIKEFGKAYGYKGVDGVVPKPNSEETGSSNSLRFGSTSQGHTPRGN